MASGEEGIPDFEYDIAFEDLIIEAEVGKGGFGTVYKASYFGTSVAVKQIPNPSCPEETLFLKREVAILKGVRHPNCVQFVGITTDPYGNTCIVTEYVSGGNLRAILKDMTKGLSWHWRVSIANDIAGAIAYLHAKLILFRDLKSKNILLGEDGKAKICDFGLARSGGGLQARPMTICGTDDWMAPEVILGMDYDQRADLFSYGIVLLEIITRAKISLELQRSPMDAFGLNVDKAKSLMPTDVPPQLSKLVFECTAYEPQDRPPFKTLVVQLAKLLKELPNKPAPSPSSSSTTSSPAAAAPKSSPKPATTPTTASPSPAKQPPPSSSSPSSSPKPAATAKPSAPKATPTTSTTNTSSPKQTPPSSSPKPASSAPKKVASKWPPK